MLSTASPQFPKSMSIGYNMAMRRFVLVAAFLASAVVALHAQDRGTVNPQPLPPLENPDDPQLAAKQLFGRKATPIKMRPQAVGFYSNGCMSGAQALPING